MTDPQEHERRRHRRFTLRKQALLYIGAEEHPFRGHLMDISETGTAIVAPRPIPVQAGVFLRFSIDPDISCEATGAVVRCHPFGDQWGLGVDLTYANQPFLNFLRNLDSVHEAERPALLADMRNLQAHFG